MRDTKNDLSINKDKFIRFSVLTGCSLLLIGGTLFFILDLKHSGILISLIGFFMVFLAPRALDMVIKLQKKAKEQNDRKR